MGPPFPTAGILVILPELCAKLNASFQYLPEIKFAFKKYMLFKALDHIPAVTLFPPLIGHA